VGADREINRKEEKILIKLEVVCLPNMKSIVNSYDHCQKAEKCKDRTYIAL